ncbi:polyamine ABC transporter permease [Hydrogenophaga sp. Root209]|uniref:ABC transporter permease n=1 Tax=unclassified Hydrogenophaga TaxID=2610897 RepID=UPI0006FA2934|nr:ABC transporter permease [Hydrogenophaga sp. Root209]KRC12120.1 polyamine ABC transporter permease [Hydrogenophaga sp. Root209]
MAKRLLIAYLLLLLSFVFAPIAASVVFSFNSDRFPTLPLGSFTFDWYVAILDDELVREAFLNSLIVSACTSLIATLLGVGAAYADYRYKFFGKRAYLALGLLPPTVPAIILGLAMLAYLSRLGLANQLYSIVLAHSVICTPFAMALIRLRLSQIDPSVEQAAWNLGANEWVALREVILPFVAPAIVSSLCLTAAVSFDEFAIAWFVGGLNETLPVRVLGFLQGQVSPRINAIGTVVFVVSIVLIVLAQMLLAHKGALRRRTLP